MRVAGTLALVVVIGSGGVGPAPAAQAVKPAVVAQVPRPAAVAQAVPDAIQVRIGVLRDGAYDVVALPLETYVARVVAGEAAAGSSPAALEAMAITIRTFALANRGRHRADGFDLCDQTHCQVMRTAVASTERAARATAGMVLLRNGVPASVYYSASCGGHTERPSAVWPGAEDPSYLPARPDAACGGFPAWTAELTTADLQRAFAAAGFQGQLRGMTVRSRSESGRVGQLSLDGITPGEISGQDLRVALGRTAGWQYVKSTAFDLSRNGNTYRFVGHGSGHGVGMCVIGATKLAEQGQTAAAILGQYFPGLVIGDAGPRLTAAPPALPSIGSAAPGRATPPGAGARPTGPAPGRAGASSVSAVSADVLVSLPDEDEGERTAVTSLSVQARSELAKALGVPTPPPITLRFHPTTTAYERATGRPWFTAAALVGREAHFVPLASLRDRGVLERTIRRELVLAMAGGALQNRPAWVREGAALFFADGGIEGARASDREAFPRGACPTDAELERPISAGTLSDAFTRARNCFGRQIVAGRSWRDVR